MREMIIAVIAVGIVAVIFAINSLKWKISTLALAYYIEKIIKIEAGSRPKSQH